MPKQSKAKPRNELPVAVATKIVQSSPKKEIRDSQMSIMQRNLDLVAARLVHKVNAKLFKYGLGCTYTFIVEHASRGIPQSRQQLTKNLRLMDSRVLFN